MALVGRDAARLDGGRRCLSRAGRREVRTYACDFAALDNVRELADSLLDDLPRIDVLINNAALVLQRREETVDGYEKVFAVNHLAPYLLTRLLLDRLVASAPARIVNVSSDAHTFGALEPDDYMSTRGFKPLKVYGRSKLANILFTVELAGGSKGTGVTVELPAPGLRLDVARPRQQARPAVREDRSARSSRSRPTARPRSCTWPATTSPRTASTSPTARCTRPRPTPRTWSWRRGCGTTAPSSSA